MKKGMYSAGEIILMILALPFVVLWELIKIRVWGIKCGI